MISIFFSLYPMTPSPWTSYLISMVVKKKKYNAFLFVVSKYLIYQTNNDGFVGLDPITKDVFNKVVTKVKDECEGAY